MKRINSKELRKLVLETVSEIEKENKAKRKAAPSLLLKQKNMLKHFTPILKIWWQR